MPLKHYNCQILKIQLKRSKLERNSLSNRFSVQRYFQKQLHNHISVFADPLSLKNSQKNSKSEISASTNKKQVVCCRTYCTFQKNPASFEEEKPLCNTKTLFIIFTFLILFHITNFLLQKGWFWYICHENLSNFFFGILLVRQYLYKSKSIREREFKI